MPSFVGDREDDAPVLLTASTFSPPASFDQQKTLTSTIIAKDASTATVTSRPLAGRLVSVEASSLSVNGHPPARASAYPPAPSFPPPSPPSLPSLPLLPLSDGLYGSLPKHASSSITAGSKSSNSSNSSSSSRRSNGSRSDSDDNMSTSSSAGMTGHSGSSNGEPASSRTTTFSDDHVLALHGQAQMLQQQQQQQKLKQKQKQIPATLHKVYLNGTVSHDQIQIQHSPSSSSSSLAHPTRPPPPPPPTLTLSSTHSPTRPLSDPLSPLTPDEPTSAPPPPPKPDTLDSFSRSSRPAVRAANGVNGVNGVHGGPISVPSPLVDRTRALPPTTASSPFSSPRQQQPPHFEKTPDDNPIRHSAASTVGSSILAPSSVDMYLRQSNRPESTILPTTSSSSGALAANASSHSLAQTQNHPLSLLPQQSQQSQQSLTSAPSSPHRFSSPAAYVPGSAATASSSSMAAPPSGPPKHRHTLEVPKPSTSARNSRDGLDTAVASGRFSPTAINAGSGGSISGSISGRRASLSLVRRNTRSMHSEMPRDEVVPDEDALRWTEAYRQKRASKKRRLEDDDQVLVGTKVDESHTNWVAAYNMLTGIRVSVSRTNAKLDRPLEDDDFNMKQKSTFDIAGNELVPSAKYDFKFKDYAPWVFRHLRALFHLDPADYLMSLAGKYILSELGSPGKSGSFFYFSRDYKYIIKTIHHSEHKFLRKILKEYYQHVKDNPNTLLSQFFGLHRVKMPYGRKIHFVVMNNLFPPHRDIHQTFDLKGSLIGREYPEDRIADNPRATLKDLNWLRRHEHLELGIIKKRLFLQQLEKDVRLLQRLQIMDYSLLVGVHDLRRGNDENLRGKTLQVFEPGADSSNPDGDPQSVLMRTPSRLEHQRKTRELRQMLKQERPIPIDQSTNRMPDELDDDSKQSVFYRDNGGFQATHANNAPGDEVYYLGVIDCLTHYGMVKKIEHFWKGLSSDRSQISALPPHQYGERFFKFMSEATMSPEEAAHERARVEAEAAMAAAGAEAAPAGTEAGLMTGRDKGKEVPQMSQHRAAAAVDFDGPRRRSEDGARSPGPSLSSSPLSNGASERRESMQQQQQQQQAILPVVEEAAGEGSSTGGQSQHSRPSSHASLAASRHSIEDDRNGRPATPSKDGLMGGRYGSGASHGSRGASSSHGHGNDNGNGNGNGNGLVNGNGVSSNGTGNGAANGNPAFLKPDSADSGYGVSGTRSRSGTAGTVGTNGSGRKLKPQISRDSLEKALPPLPAMDRAA